MKTSITEEMRFRQKVVEYAMKHNNNAKSGKAILPSTLNRRFNLSKNPSPLKYGVISA